MSKVKAKAPKPLKPPKPKGIPNRHLHARTAFLYQAATYLTLQSARVDSEVQALLDRGASTGPSHSPVALRLGADLQQVSRKAQLRLAVDLKRSMCKSCNIILVPGQTATQAIENHSKGGRKPWADVLVLQCRFCSSKKRFPIGSTQQSSNSKRAAALVNTTNATSQDEISLFEAPPLTENVHNSRVD